VIDVNSKYEDSLTETRAVFEIDTYFSQDHFAKYINLLHL